jgi:tryptophanyl-tRNA synthetase
MTFSAMKAGLDKDGMPVALQHKVIAPSLSAADDATFKDTKEDGSMTEALNDQKYEIPNLKNPYVFADLHIPIAAWRAVTSTTLAFAHECFIDELAAVVDPARAILFIQSQVPEHAELHLLLSMMTPLGWLERVPTYKDQQEKLTHKDLTTYGFLGYPLLQAADILLYRADQVPVGEDQVAHLELCREIARRFNNLYGDLLPEPQPLLTPASA